MNGHNINQLRYHYDFSYQSNEKKFRGLDILQIGDLSCSFGYAVTAHDQWCHEITLVLAGEADFTVNDSVLKVREGDLCISPRGSTHEIVATSETFRYAYLGFEFDLLEPDIHQDERVFFREANRFPDRLKT